MSWCPPSPVGAQVHSVPSVLYLGPDAWFDRDGRASPEQELVVRVSGPG